MQRAPHADIHATLQAMRGEGDINPARLLWSRLDGLPVEITIREPLIKASRESMDAYIAEVLSWDWPATPLPEPRAPQAI